MVVCGECLDRFGSPDVGFPDAGIIALGTLDAPGWGYADVDFGAAKVVRADDVVLNRRHWGLQQGRTDPAPVTSLVD
ncbi:MAG: hypothetical protein ABJP79_18685 [Tateyamaria sp.]|uniref:hypothetical protein n=1 Tax=Tateyamaria sp. TaxID=1929288 RepID=UPI0032A0C973